MPWNPAQHRLFEAAAHNPAIARAHGMSQQKAGQMASEGIKQPSMPQMPSAKAQALAKGLMRRG